MIKTEYKCRRCEEVKHYTDFEKSLKTNRRRSRTCITCIAHMNKEDKAEGTAKIRAIMKVPVNIKSTSFYYMSKLPNINFNPQGLR